MNNPNDLMRNPRLKFQLHTNSIEDLRLQSAKHLRLNSCQSPQCPSEPCRPILKTKQRKCNKYFSTPHTNNKYLSTPCAKKSQTTRMSSDDREVKFTDICKFMSWHSCTVNKAAFCMSSSLVCYFYARHTNGPNFWS